MILLPARGGMGVLEEYSATICGMRNCGTDVAGLLDIGYLLFVYVVLGKRFSGSQALTLQPILHAVPVYCKFTLGLCSFIGRKL
jgi:hypothetical protein